MRRFLLGRWFLIALVAIFGVGIIWGPQLEALTRLKSLRYAIVATVLFLMALPLQAGAIWEALRRPAAPLLAVAINFGLTPLVGWLLSQALGDDLGMGLLVASATPCTLASAAVWTRRAGGNDTTAILVTIITNLFCFLVTPFWVLSLTGQSVEVSLGAMVIKLALLVVLPMTMAQLLRFWPEVARRATEAKIPLGVLAQCGILSMVFLGAIQTGMRLRGGSSSHLVGELLLMVGSVLVLHSAMLAVGWLVAGLFGMDRSNRIAVGFAGSQKTLMVGLQVSLDVHASILPMVCYHVGQLFLDTLIADRFRREEQRRAESGENG